jgi:hypothetical protein
MRDAKMLSAAEIVGLIATVLVGLTGVVVGPFVKRYVRTMGKVQCNVVSWHPQRSAYSPGGNIVEERRLQVRFVNGKDLPVTVSEMRVEFYREGQPLEDWTRPQLEFADEHDQKRPLGLVNVPAHEHQEWTISVTPGRDDIVRELKEADRAVFVASIDGVGDKRVELTPPW